MLNLIITLMLSVILSSPQSYADSVVIVETGSDYMLVEPLGLYQSDYHEIQYTINHDPEDLFVGDILSVTMSDSGSPDILDDSVIDYKYAGYLW